MLQSKRTTMKRKKKWKKKRTTNKNTNNYIVRRVSKIRIERKVEEKSDTFVHVSHTKFTYILIYEHDKKH